MRPDGSEYVTDSDGALASGRLASVSLARSNERPGWSQAGQRPALLFFVTIAATLLLACVEQQPAVDYGDPTLLNEATRQNGVVAWVVSPLGYEVQHSPVVDLKIAAYTEDEPSNLRVLVATEDGTVRVATPVGLPGPEQRFHTSVSLLHGSNQMRITVESTEGVWLHAFDFSLSYEGYPPGLGMLSLSRVDPGQSCQEAQPLSRNVTSSLAICVRGRVTASPGESVVSVAVARSGGPENLVAPDGSGVFEARVELLPNQINPISVAVVDTWGDETAITFQIVQDSIPPDLQVSQPASTAPVYTDDASFDLAGTAYDANGIAAMWVQNGGNSLYIAPEPAWSATVFLATGDNAMLVLAQDMAGNLTQRPLLLVRNRIIHLGAPQLNQGGLSLELDRYALETLLSVADQRQLDLVSVDLRPAIIESLRFIREPQRFDVDTSEWGAAEHNLNRLLNMTPDTADLRDTSVENMLELGSAIGLPSPRILADILDIDVTDTFLPLNVVADVILEQLLGTHPNIGRDADGRVVLDLTMYDVLQDLRTIAPRFGPVGAHPGFLQGTSESQVLESGFLMSVLATSNLTQYDGVDASAISKDYLFLLEGGPGAPIIEFDFLDPETFTVVGIVDEPTVDLRMGIGENPHFLSAGTQRTANPDSERPGFYRGNGEVWQTPLWELCHIVAQSTYLQFHDKFSASNYTRTLSYDAGSIEDAASVTWNRGWLHVDTPGDIGSPPPDQYVWDMLLEVAQVRLHEGGLDEGEADVAFTLEGLSVGLTADELIEALRPALQSQQEELLELMFGTRGLAESRSDLFYVPSQDGGAGFLFFRAPSDEEGHYAYSRPGFFADAALGQKVSVSHALPGTGDNVHEKVRVAAGESYYFQDDLGQVYRIDIVGQSSDGIDVRVTPEVRP